MADSICARYGHEWVELTRYGDAERSFYCVVCQAEKTKPLAQWMTQVWENDTPVAEIDGFGPP